MMDTTRFDKLIEFRKERKSSGISYDIFSTGIILLLWYGFNNQTFAIIYLIVYILSVLGYGMEIAKIDDQIKNELAKMAVVECTVDN